MLSPNKVLATLFTLTILASGITSCGTGNKTETPSSSSTTTTTTPESTVDVPADSEIEPNSTASKTAEPPITSSPKTSTPPYAAIPDLKGATPEPLSPPSTTPKTTPSITPTPKTQAPDVGNIEPKKPTPKPKSESKTKGQSVASAVESRKRLFAKALSEVPNKDAKFNEYYGKLSTLVTKIEVQKPLTQESIDSVNQLNAQYPEQAVKFNTAMQKVMPAKRKG